MGNRYYEQQAFGNQGRLPDNPIPPTPQRPIPTTPLEQMTSGRDQLSQAGVQVNFHSLNGVRLKLQIHTIAVTAANTRYDFDFLSQVTNDRIVGFFMTSSESKPNELEYNLNHSEIQLTIDNNEIIPPYTDAALFSSKIGSGFYDNMYRINERADASQIKGSYTSGPLDTFPTGGYKVKLFFWCVEKPKN